MLYFECRRIGSHSCIESFFQQFHQRFFFQLSVILSGSDLVFFCHLSQSPRLFTDFQMFFIHRFSLPDLSNSRIQEGAGAYPRYQWMRGRVYPGQVACPSQGQHKDKHAYPHSLLHSVQRHQFSRLTCTFLAAGGSWRTLREPTHAQEKLARFKQGNVLL